jgi:hypothetical protein
MQWCGPPFFFDCEASLPRHILVSVEREDEVEGKFCYVGIGVEKSTSRPNKEGAQQNLLGLARQPTRKKSAGLQVLQDWNQ